MEEGDKKIQKYVFSMKRILGKGSYATVYLGKSTLDDIPIAVKVIDKRIFANNYNLKSIQSQIQIMKKTKHSNIVQLLDVFRTTNNLYIIMQYCQQGDLRDFIKNNPQLPQDKAIIYLKQILNGFEYLNQHGIIHRDLKPANILIHNNQCKISDFGFAKNLENGQNTVLMSIVGTPLYMSPQILNHQPYTSKSDIWSVGLIYYELLHGYTPWPAVNEIQLLSNIMRKNIQFQSHVSDLSRDFIKKCLKIKEEDRISWEEAFSHPLVNETERIFSKDRSKSKMRPLQERRNRLQIIATNKSKSRSTTSHKGFLSRTPKNKSQYMKLRKLE